MDHPGQPGRWVGDGGTLGGGLEARRGGAGRQRRTALPSDPCVARRPYAFSRRSSSSPTPERPLNPTAQARVFPPQSPRGRTDGRTEPPDLFLSILRHKGGGKACEPGGARRGEARPPRSRNHVNDPSAVQFSSVTQSCQTLCDPVNSSRPGLRVHHQLPESTQTHVH